MSAPRLNFPYGSGGGGGVSGTGTANTIPRWTGASTLGDSGLIDNGTAIYTTTRSVGIGTASPGSRLTVAGTGGTSVISMLETGVRNWAIRSGGAATNIFDIADLTAGFSRLAIDSTGNVGIGTATPATANSRLTVAGGFIVPAAGFGVYQAGDHLTLQAGAGKNVHLRPNDGGVLAVNVGSATCDMSAVAGYVLAVGGPTRAAGSTAPIPAFSSTTDTNTGMYFPSSDTLRFSVGGLPAVSITSAKELQFDSGFGSVANAYGCRAWVNFNGTGVIAIRASGNVSSITDAAVGQYVVNFTSAMPDINYAAIGTKQNVSTNADVSFYDCINAVASIPARTVNASGWQCLEGSAYVDSTNVNVAYFR